MHFKSRLEESLFLEAENESLDFGMDALFRSHTSTNSFIASTKLILSSSPYLNSLDLIFIGKPARICKNNTDLFQWAVGKGGIVEGFKIQKSNFN